MTIQDAVLRLERAGSESSKTTQKLREAVATTAAKIAEILATSGVECDMSPIGQDGFIYLNLMPGYKQLPDAEKGKWGGIACYYYAPKGSILYAGDPLSGYGEILNPPKYVNGMIPEPVSRENCLMFAKHVANGLLGLVAEWLEKRTAADIRAIARLEVK